MHSLCYIGLGQTGFSYPLGIFKCHPVYFRVYFLHHSLNFMFMAESRETQIVSAGGKKLPPLPYSFSPWPCINLFPKLDTPQRSGG